MGTITVHIINHGRTLNMSFHGVGGEGLPLPVYNMELVIIRAYDDF